MMNWLVGCVRHTTALVNLEDIQPAAFNAWTNSRDFPAFPKESFCERYAKRKKGQQP
jgi:hypothetical protein